MLKKLIQITGLFLMFLAPGSTFAQEDFSPTWESENGLFVVSYESQLNPIVINQIHSWTLHVSTVAGEPVVDADIEVQGGMPEHNHGLATAPTIESQGDGDYLLQGLRFHMMGYWELELAISGAGTSDRVVIKLDL